MKTTAKKKAGISNAIVDVENELRQLAQNLETDLSRRKKEQEKRDYGPRSFNFRVHQYKLEAARLLTKAVDAGGFSQFGRLQRIIGTTRPKSTPDFGDSRAFEYACLRWIPKQPDGFDFQWKRKQRGDVKAYIMALRYLADCLAKSRIVTEHGGTFETNRSGRHARR